LRGTFIEPVRLDFRFGLPKKWKVDAAVARLGWLNFPAGFDFAAFAGSPGHDGRISSDWAKTLSIFVDLTPIAQTWAEKLKLK
jgi:hypothetical protein